MAILPMIGRARLTHGWGWSNGTSMDGSQLSILSPIEVFNFNGGCVMVDQALRHQDIAGYICVYWDDPIPKAADFVWPI